MFERVLGLFVGVGSAMLLLAAAPAGAADYRIRKGDVIEVSVAGAPELRERATVQPDGAVVLPLVGAVEVEGLPSTALRETIKAQFAGKIHRRFGNDGREVLTLVRAEDVSAAIVDYGPIYVTGAVARPGAEAFRPGMTVRQAVALAGGVQIPGAQLGASAANLPALLSDWRLAQIGLARAIARTARLRAELDGDARPLAVEFDGVALSRESLDDIRKSEAAMLEARRADEARERAFLHDAAERADQRIAVLGRQQAAEEEGTRADAAELQRLVDLLNRGVETNPRVTDARRAVLLSSTRALQVNAELLDLQRQKAENIRASNRFEDERRIRLLRELDEAESSEASSRIRLEALQTQLGVARHAVNMNDPFGGFAQTIELVRQDQGSTRSAANDDTLLTPGDVVYVSLRTVDASAEARP